MFKPLALLVTAGIIFSQPWKATAAPPEQNFAAYALIVGSNLPGPGQPELMFAVADSERVKEVLIEIGGYLPGRVQTLHDPTGGEVERAIAGFSQRLAEHRQRGEQSVFLFYYSGHARADALSLGNDEIALKRMWVLLESLPATLKIVVLDACQTGAISNVKGVEPATSFSYNTVNQLNTSGMAIMASSCGSELSQESEALGGSFFTHHLVAGLRGAADQNRDGRVTLAEAHHYAYNRTLVDTAQTKIGKQHATLETNLSGQGETVLTWPSDAGAWLEIPAGIKGQVLVYRKNDPTVMAEVEKVSGGQIRLALPPSDYGVVVREGDRAVRCEIGVKQNEAASLSMDDCEEIELADLAPKGDDDVLGVHVEALLGGMHIGTDDYVKRLGEFGYEAIDSPSNSLHYALYGCYSIGSFLQVGLEFSTLDDAYYWGTGDQQFEWKAYRFGPMGRAVLPSKKGVVLPYLQLGVGAALVKTTYQSAQDLSSEYHWGFSFGLGGGLKIKPWKRVGFQFEAEYVFAQPMENLIGDKHFSGGFDWAAGLFAVL